MQSPTQAEAQLRAINHRFVNAYANADLAFVDALTAQDFLMIGGSGEWIDRSGHLESLSKPAVTGSVSYDDVRVRRYGSVALVQGVFEALGASDDVASRRVRYTDVYHWNGVAWLLVSAQNTPLREGVAKYLHQGSAPPFVRWQRTDPVGDDLDVLRELNESYVRAFREADVAWYDAHLSTDYNVVNSDGSFHDRARALEEFAKPVFATTIKSFPVDKVQIRRFDDIALIHAENDYELKDGRHGISRYTDVWHKQDDGRWKCVGAHITAYRLPT
jgi:ketosteroid isomerase-like protein